MCSCLIRTEPIMSKYQLVAYFSLNPNNNKKPLKLHFDHWKPTGDKAKGLISIRSIPGFLPSLKK